MNTSAHERYIKKLYVGEDAPPKKPRPAGTAMPDTTDNDCSELVDELNRLFDELFGDCEDDS